jgi:hypothetical protein
MTEIRIHTSGPGAAVERQIGPRRREPAGVPGGKRQHDLEAGVAAAVEMAMKALPNASRSGPKVSVQLSVGILLDGDAGVTLTAASAEGAIAVTVTASSH